ncbi:MAG: hypothetical protein EOM83_13025 [Clostridia bacterium]|nr:hypothetical protein [Clostridia bacterium]
MSTSSSAEICCPEFNPHPWDDKLHHWQNKMFIKDKVFSVFYMPINFGSVMKRLDSKMSDTDVEVPDNLCLADHTSMWNMDVYLSVDQQVPEADNTTLSGSFYSKVYEGSFNNTGKWMKDFSALLKSKGMISTKNYSWYTTCPKCAKKYGKNYVVLFAKIG